MSSEREFKKEKGTINNESNEKQQNVSETSPDISLSSQNTLRYSDVEEQSLDHNVSHESSDSIEAIEEPFCETIPSGVNQTFLHLTLNPGSQRSGSGGGSSDRVSINSDAGSADSHEVIQEFCPLSRPESLSLGAPVSENKLAEAEHASMPILEAETGSVSKGEDGLNAATTSYKTVPHPVSISTSSRPSAVTEPVGSHQAEARNQRAEETVTESSSLSQSLPQGTITRKGDMIQFVASDLQEKIKQSSPISQPDGASSNSRRSSIRSFASASSSTSFATSSGMSQSPGSSGCQQSPEDIPPIDATAVIELENYAARVADSLDLMMGNIRNNLHKMSAITIGCQDAYKRSVDITCDSVDGGIKTMYALMAKCEELNASMAPVKQLANQIKEIKRILDLFEVQLADK